MPRAAGQRQSRKRKIWIFLHAAEQILLETRASSLLCMLTPQGDEVKTNRIYGITSVTRALALEGNDSEFIGHSYNDRRERSQTEVLENYPRQTSGAVFGISGCYQCGDLQGRRLRRVRTRLNVTTRTSLEQLARPPLGAEECPADHEDCVAIRPGCGHFRRDLEADRCPAAARPCLHSQADHRHSGSSGKESGPGSGAALVVRGCRIRTRRFQQHC